MSNDKGATIVAPPLSHDTPRRAPACELAPRVQRTHPPRVQHARGGTGHAWARRSHMFISIVAREGVLAHTPTDKLIPTPQHLTSPDTYRLREQNMSRGSPGIHAVLRSGPHVVAGMMPTLLLNADPLRAHPPLSIVTSSEMVTVTISLLYYLHKVPIK